MTGNKIFLDSNIVLYLHDDGIKFEKAKELLLLQPFINSQVVAEYANVCIRKYKFGKPILAQLIDKLLLHTILLPVNEDILHHATKLMLRYDFQYFDAIIVASALESNCQILYSEDLQHQQIIENKLKIVNPFI